MGASLAGGLLLKMLKYFEVMLNTFLFFPRDINCRILISSCKYVFMNHPIVLLDQDNKIKLVPASFSSFLEILYEKNKS